jgi:hypothetical protein
MAMKRTVNNDTAPLDIELRIDRLVVDDALLDEVNPRTVHAAVEIELSRLLAGVSAKDLLPVTLAHVKFADVHAPRPMAATALGTYVSSAIGSALSPPTEPRE